MHSVNENDIKSPVGIIIPFAGKIVPPSYLICDGRTLLKTDYTELFEVLGNTYGSVTTTSFNIPDLRGRTIIGTGGGTNLTNRLVGATGGTESETLTIAKMPSHTHTGKTSGAGEHIHGYFPFFDTSDGKLYDCGKGAGTCPFLYNPTGFLDNGGDKDHRLYTNLSDEHNHTLNIIPTGNSNSHNNLQPFLSLNYIIKVY